MKILLGENIRNLRNKQHITQEQLAEALGISSKAVSRWENESTFPDISLLPVIANYFDVTTDYLLGADTVHKQEEIDRILKKNMEFSNAGKTEERIKLLRESLNSYPNEPQLLYNLAAALYSLYFISGTEYDAEKKRSGALEIIDICKRAVKYSEDIWIDSGCREHMILCYAELGERVKALELADALPSLWQSSELIKPRIYEQSDPKRASEMYQHSLINLIDATNHCINIIRWISGFSDKEKLEISRLQENFLLSFIGDNPLFYNDRLFDTAQCQCYYHLQLGEKEKCLDALERACKYAEGFEERPEVGKYSVHWLSAVEDRRDGTTKHNARTYYEDLLGFIYYRELHKVYEGDERLTEIMQRLEQKING